MTPLDCSRLSPGESVRSQTTPLRKASPVNTKLSSPHLITSQEVLSCHAPPQVCSKHEYNDHIRDIFRAFSLPDNKTVISPIKISMKVINYQINGSRVAIGNNYDAEILIAAHSVAVQCNRLPFKTLCCVWPAQLPIERLHTLVPGVHSNYTIMRSPHLPPAFTADQSNGTVYVFTTYDFINEKKRREMTQS